MQTTDIKKLEESTEAFLYAEDVGRFLGLSPQYIRLQARHDPSKLGFPVIVVGSSVRIPRIPFLNFVKGSHDVFRLEDCLVNDPENWKQLDLWSPAKEKKAKETEPWNRKL